MEDKKGVLHIDNADTEELSEEEWEKKKKLLEMEREMDED